MSRFSESPALEFPCEFPIKAMGLNRGDFRALVTEIVHRHVAAGDRAAVHERDSRGGKYLAVTVTITARSRAQLDAIYQDLTDEERVVVAL